MSLMLCGACHHPMHWKVCGADADQTAPCQCHNDGERPTPEQRQPATARLDALWEALAQDIHAHGYSVRDALAAHRDAIEAEAAAPAALDVERLARALHSQHATGAYLRTEHQGWDGKWYPDTHRWCLRRDQPRADRIAAEYEKLSRE